MAASYRDLGPTQLLQGTVNQVSANPYGAANWEIAADQRALNCWVAQAEIYQIAIDGPVGSSMTMFRNKRAWNTVLQGWSNYNDPVQPLYVRPGDTIFLYWNSALTPVPTATLWLRYDTELPENKQR